MTGYELLIRRGHSCVTIVFLFDWGVERLAVPEAEKCRLAKVPVSALSAEGVGVGDQADLSFYPKLGRDLASRFFSFQFQFNFSKSCI